MANYPISLDSYTNPQGTSLLTSPDHALDHTAIHSAIVAIETTAGTTAGTNVLKNFAVGDFPARINGSNVLQQVITGTVNTTVGTLSGAVIGTPAISAGTWSNPQLIGTAQITGGTVASSVVNNATVGTPAITGGTITSRLVKRVSTVASSGTPTPNADTDDMYTVTAQAVAGTFGAPTGTPTNGQPLLLRVVDSGTARAVAFNAAYRFSTDLSAPTTTTVSKTMYLGFVWNSASSTWDCIAKLDNF